MVTKTPNPKKREPAPKHVPAPKLIIVTGMPRSGTSLMMRILRNSRVRVLTDDNPSFEMEKTDHLMEDNKWVTHLDPKIPTAFKVLWPQFVHLPWETPMTAIWMGRNPREQAKSQRKFGHLMGQNIPRSFLSPRTKLLTKVDASATSFIQRQEWVRFIRVSFEDLVTSPHVTCRVLSRELGFTLDPSCVVPRDPCNGPPVGTFELTYDQDGSPHG